MKGGFFIEDLLVETSWRSLKMELAGGRLMKVFASLLHVLASPLSGVCFVHYAFHSTFRAPPDGFDV